MTRIETCNHHPIYSLCIPCAKENRLHELIEENTKLKDAMTSYLSKHCACCTRGRLEKERDQAARETLNGLNRQGEIK